jgi:kynurenine 3-monooxygenase
MSVYLARAGYTVDLYEVRGDPRIAVVDPRRAINLTLTYRGISALAGVGLDKLAMAASVPLSGRMVHRADGSVSLQLYGARPHELLYAVRRSELTAALIDAAMKEPRVAIHFDTRCTRIDPGAREVFLEDQLTGRQFSLVPHHIVGADGTYSTVRRHMQNNLGADSRLQSLNWGYKEIVISAQERPEAMVNGVLHAWPRGDRLLLAIPNADGSFLCTCVLPFQGADSFESLTTPAAVRDYFQREFPDLNGSIDVITDQFPRHPVATFGTMRTAPWHYRGNVLLIGDACHTVYPFYGQGLNSALEDCAIWHRSLTAHDHDWDRAAPGFQDRRKPSTDALVELSAQNFTELRATSASRWLTARKRVDLALARLLPVLWIPLYTMVSHSTMPYDRAVRRERRQKLIARWLGIHLLIAVTAGYDLLADRFRSRKVPVPAQSPVSDEEVPDE